jgi:hypothetical protein
MSTAQSRLRWLRGGAAALGVAALLAAATPAYASGGGGGGGGGTTTPTLRTLTFSPAAVTGGGGDTATATFASAPSQGAVVTVSSSNPAVATFQENVLQENEVVFPPGQASAAFAVVTNPVTTPTQVTITASAFGTTTISATLTVNPGVPPAPDTVHVTRFQWNRGIQQIEATSSNPNAVLNVFFPDGTWTGITLTNEGGGKYQDQREEVFPPDEPETVQSNFGGSATATASVSS